MIGIINYGVSNVGSMLNIMRKIGVEAEVISAPGQLAGPDKIILPGIGAFDNGMTALTDLGFTEPLKRRVLEERVPLLGVCLGMQMLGEGSEEGSLGGLSLVHGRSIRFRSTEADPIRIPHMGWNELKSRVSSPLLQGLERGRFYFVHSYHLVCDEPADQLATASYGGDFTAAVHHDNVWGVQFHPEKSHRFGMALLKNFATL